MVTKTRMKSLCSKQRLLLTHNKKSVSPIFLQKMILPAVIIKLYCFKLVFGHTFVQTIDLLFSAIDNCIYFGYHSNEI